MNHDRYAYGIKFNFALKFQILYFWKKIFGQEENFLTGWNLGGGEAIAPISPPPCHDASASIAALSCEILVRKL